MASLQIVGLPMSGVASLRSANKAEFPVGRLKTKFVDFPIRWLVMMEDTSNPTGLIREEIFAENSLGDVVARAGVSIVAASTSSGAANSTLEFSSLSAAPARDNRGDYIGNGSGASTRRIQRKRGSQGQCGGSGNSGSSTEDNNNGNRLDVGAGKAKNNKALQKKAVSFTGRGRASSVASEKSATARATGESKGNDRTTASTDLAVMPKTTMVVGTNAAGKGVLTREERSRRRQDPALQGPSASGNGSGAGRGISKTLDIPADGHERVNSHLYPFGCPKGKKMKLTCPSRDDSEVLKVKMLTGTLFLYRGTQRRVEFVPKM